MDKDKTIIKALRLGIPISTIAKKVGVTRIYIYWRLKHDMEYKQAREFYLSCIKNVFK